MTIQEMIDIAVAEGYSEADAEAKVCQDIVLKGIADSSLSRNATIKGGVVMRSLSKDTRRATQDLDIDFIKYSLSNEAIDCFVNKINCVKGITIKQSGAAKELKQQDYHGKRIYVTITDETGDSIKSKIDLGVHKLMELTQEEYCFDISYFDEGANLLINTKEQMLTEKLKSLLRFGTLSTRYKDVFDIWYLSKLADKKALMSCFDLIIFNDEKVKETSIAEIAAKIASTLNDNYYFERLEKSKKNWTDYDEKQIVAELISYLNNLDS